MPHHRTRCTGDSTPDIVVQLIIVSWTKRARGGVLATPRNRVPERLTFPEALLAPPEAATIGVHTVAFGQANDFTAAIDETVRWAASLPVPLEGCLHLVGLEERLALQVSNYAPYVPVFPPEPVAPGTGYRHPPLAGPPPPPAIVTEYTGMGAPRRAVPLRPVVLRPGEWGQARFLGRHRVSWGQELVYRKYVYNVAWRAQMTPRVFLDTDPAHRYESLPDVW